MGETGWCDGYTQGVEWRGQVEVLSTEGGGGEREREREENGEW